MTNFHWEMSASTWRNRRTRTDHGHMGVQATVFSGHMFQKAYNQAFLDGHNYLDHILCTNS